MSLKRVARLPALQSSPFIPKRTCSRRGYATAQEPSSLRAKPWSFGHNPSPHTAPGSELSKGNAALAHAFNHKRSADVFSIAAQMKDRGTRPNIETYNHLLNTCAYEGRFTETWAILDDMLLCEVAPNVTSFLAMMKAHRGRPTSYLWTILDKMEEHNVAPNASVYGLLIQRFARDRNLELCLKYLQTMREKNLPIEYQPMSDLTSLAAIQGYPRLALEMIDAYEAANVRKVESDLWVQCLAACATAMWPAGTERCWRLVTKEWQMTPEEGICSRVLDVAARSGDPNLASEVLTILQSAGIQWREHHVSALIHSMATNSRVKSAFQALKIMQASDIDVSIGTLDSIAKMLAKDIYFYDEVWTVLDEVKAEAGSIDTAVMNAVLLGAVELKDIQRLVGTYQAFPDYNTSYDLNSFHIFLRGLVITKRRDLANAVLKNILAAKIAPTKETYRLMIVLCLTQDSYEDAFHYLEESKAAGHKPGKSVYEAIIEKCASHGDSRYMIAVEEMSEQGYNMSEHATRRVQGMYDDAQRISTADNSSV